MLLCAPRCPWVSLGAPGCPWVPMGAPGCSWMPMGTPDCPSVPLPGCGTWDSVAPPPGFSCSAVNLSCSDRASLTWGLLGPSWAPRRPQDATKTYPRAAQNNSQDALGSQNRPGTQNKSKMKPRPPQNRAPKLVFFVFESSKNCIHN